MLNTFSRSTDFVCIDNGSKAFKYSHKCKIKKETWLAFFTKEHTGYPMGWFAISAAGEAEMGHAGITAERNAL